ncbi:hypothetical protein LSH36_95g04004 [Paralvinella palmiformis]|uniref:Uncharacterized protein n=1 Tax=Paralvinella palmiformis TaxID=53620 RepID=A0AAD9K0K6_9ANNE|nr:hypothetical protein LSH36_95g04004 [Paralvinella palmiformis]
MYGGSKRGLCHSITDPHLLTFDGSRYDVFEKDTDGIYYLFKCRKAKLKMIETLLNCCVIPKDTTDSLDCNLLEVCYNGAGVWIQAKIFTSGYYCLLGLGRQQNIDTGHCSII